MKNFIATSILIFSTFLLSAQIKHALRDESGRHVIGRGYVVVTNNSFFTSDDYLRMVRLGANWIHKSSTPMLVSIYKRSII